ncbi:AAA ATPase central domain protein [Catenulispora acidiphila DSM 44928]|uniref:AAA ATPase central domain protein n=1 Tax=Catenulispora acidiphila (strain DSM 44928 / JCM 14897 / NBRC 102108 / NRRL B-24433 / ID139908) TaxID=479433 RepID=C7Q3J7_CATAD|nr:AAA family ATPase [Catenulispora acidiphila]ACU75762.1 AAA ATPase central domain protein [Catenulispora acidiphila DSM 44928]
MTSRTSSASSRALPDVALPGVADARTLPDRQFADAWASIEFPEGVKERLLRTVIAKFRLRRTVPFETMPLHGVVLLTGVPGVGKTTVARGLADKTARTLHGIGDWAFIEVDPHALAGSALGRSQRAVEQLFGQTLSEAAADGPLVVLLDEVETLAADRSALSMEANPIDVHRAVDAALVGIDRLAQQHPDVLVIATSNFPGGIDPALTSRADAVFQIPLPDAVLRRRILESTAAAVAAAFPGAQSLCDPTVLDAAAQLSEGIDGRRLRKAVASACAWRPEALGDPENVTGEDLLAALQAMRVER